MLEKVDVLIIGSGASGAAAMVSALTIESAARRAAPVEMRIACQYMSGTDVKKMVQPNERRLIT